MKKRELDIMFSVKTPWWSIHLVNFAWSVSYALSYVGLGNRDKLSQALGNMCARLIAKHVKFVETNG